MADCGCDFAGTGGEMCPEAMRLAEAVAAAYARGAQSSPRSWEEYDRAREAYRAHVEAAP